MSKSRDHVDRELPTQLTSSRRSRWWSISHHTIFKTCKFTLHWVETLLLIWIFDFQHSPYRQMWFINDDKSEKNSFYVNKASHQHEQVTSSLNTHPPCQSKSLNDIQEMSTYQNYFRFEIKCGNASFVYEKSKSRAVGKWFILMMSEFSYETTRLKTSNRQHYFNFGFNDTSKANVKPF